MERITNSQLFTAFSIFAYTSAAGFALSGFIKEAEYESVAALILAAAFGFLPVYFAYKLSRRRPHEHFVKYGQEIVGKWLHIPLMILFGFFFLHAPALIMKQLADFIVQNYLPGTPDWAITSMFGLCIAIAVRSGLEVIFRFAQIYFLFITAALFGGDALLSPQLPTYRMFAFATHFDSLHIWRGIYLMFPFYAEMVLIVVIFPNIMSNIKTFRTIAGSAILGTIMLLMTVIPVILLFGVKLPANLTYPTLETVRYIHIGDFLENLDPLLAGVWIASLFIKLSVMIYVAVQIAAQLMKMKHYRPLSFSLTAVSICLAHQFGQNFADVSEYYERFLSTETLIVAFIPSLYLAVDVIRSKWGKKESRQENNSAAAGPHKVDEPLPIGSQGG